VIYIKKHLSNVVRVLLLQTENKPYSKQILRIIRMTPKSLTDTILSLKQHTAQIIEISNQSIDDVISNDIREMALTDLLEIEHTIEHIEHIKASLNTAINALDTDNKYLLKDALFSAMHAINHQSPVKSFDKYESAPSLAG